MNQRRVPHFSLPLREVGTLTFCPPRWISAIELGEGKKSIFRINLHQLGFTDIRTVLGENATHVFIKKR